MTENSVRPIEKGAEDEIGSMFAAVGTLSTQLAAIEKFVARRFDELSMEINATSQQVDMAEEGIIKRFSEILEVLKAISFSGDGNTPANAGVELDAVVNLTEEAANRIMDAAGRIQDTVAGAKIDAQSLEDINADIDSIFMACSFQDITGQRIRKTLESLREIEARLNTALQKMGIEVEVSTDPLLSGQGLSQQDDIDKLFG